MIDCARMERFAPVSARRVTLPIDDAVEAPQRMVLTAYA